MPCNHVVHHTLAMTFSGRDDSTIKYRPWIIIIIIIIIIHT